MRGVVDGRGTPGEWGPGVRVDLRPRVRWSRRFRTGAGRRTRAPSRHSRRTSKRAASRHWSIAELERGGRDAARKGTCLRDLPSLLDVVTLGLSSGLSFDAALALYCERYDSELAASFAEAMLSWQVGAESRAEALQGGSRSSASTRWRASRRQSRRLWSLARRSRLGARPRKERRRDKGGAEVAARGGDREGAGEDAHPTGDPHRAGDAHLDTRALFGSEPLAVTSAGTEWA